MQPLKFGVNIPTSAAPDADPIGQALEAEALGYDFVSASDHPSGNHPTFETWTLLTWIAAATTRIAIASRVLSVPFRSPALVAKMAESLDRISGGRLILGLGAGATDQELQSFGLPVPSPRQKIDGLADAVRIIHGMWSQPAYSYRGSVHHTDSALMEPKPARRIPVWLGTFGDRALAVTGRHGDGWIPSLGYAPIDQLPAMRQKVFAAAEAAGRDPADITCALNIEIALDCPDAAGPTGISGTAEAVTDALLDFVALGFTAFNFMPIGTQATEQTRRLAAEVIPTVRTMA